jgi:S1-C subfamily serine protease
MDLIQNWKDLQENPSRFVFTIDSPPMKLLLPLFLFTSLVYARSVVPERVVTPSLDMYSRSNKTLPDGSIEVRVTTVGKRGDFSQNGSKKILSKETYESYKKSSDAVFEMIPNQNSGDDERKGRRGTAFSIGENLVLTNNHVLDETFRNTTECSDFEVKDHTGETYDCKTVHFCSPEHDICLIEMQTKTKTKRDCFLCSGTKYEVSLAQGPSLKLKATFKPEVEKWQETMTTAIGNSQGYGIHFSQGKGVSFIKDRIYFWAPITKGNSGGALLNDAGEVIGVVKLQSSKLISSDANEVYNIAAPSETVIRLVREALRDNPETLLKFNKSVVE